MARLADFVFGTRLRSAEEEHQKVGPVTALPMLGLDGLASSAYGPEAALTVLIPAGVLGLAYGVPVIGVILGLLLVLYFSYRQTMAAYPGGGGSYTVATENLGRLPGLFAAAALLLDYVLVVAVGISAGAAALASAIPGLQPHLLSISLVILVIITLVNLRGTKESGIAFVLPTYGFLIAMAIVLGIGTYRALTSGGAPVPVVPPVPLENAAAPVGLWLLARSFASGCTAMTGVEAVSNGMSAFREPRVKNAQTTLTLIVVFLGVLLAGIVLLSKAYGIGAVEPTAANYQSVISQLTQAVVGRGFLYYATIAMTLAVLALSANTGFADFPRLCRLLAQDDHLPHGFAQRGRRLVYTRGILTIAVLAAILLWAFDGITDHLIPLFAVGAFLAFTLSQAGMAVHWWRLNQRGGKFLVNAFGAVATAVALIVVLVAKFTEGAWLTVILVPGLVLLFRGIRSHYVRVAKELLASTPFRPSEIASPYVILPVKGWDLVAEKALRFSLALSDRVEVVHVSEDEAGVNELREKWDRLVVPPLVAAGRPVPTLRTSITPYRRLINPLLDEISAIRDAQPGGLVCVVIPELVEPRPWLSLLHNGRATALKGALLFRGDRRTVVVNVPWYFGEERAH